MINESIIVLLNLWHEHDLKKVDTYLKLNKE